MKRGRATQEGDGAEIGGLAPYASHSAQSRGRAFSASPSPTRGEFQRDRDRIIHSTAFRRLQHKTQVFLHHEGHHFRTRLTHTLEVSQIARSIARALRLNEDLAEAIALAHDLGHTPFGHAGERVLERLMAEWGGFDHNEQALRVVTRIENRYAAHDGLNLTWETLEGILKHNGPVPEAVAARVAPILDGIPEREKLLAPAFASLEAQIAAIADDIAYDAHDIDDAARAGLLTPADLLAAPVVADIVRRVEAAHKGLERGRMLHEIQRRLITAMIEDVIAASAGRIAAADPASADAVRALPHALIGFSESLREDERGLKAFMFANVYRHGSVMAPVRESERVVERLFLRYRETGDMPGRWGEAYAAAPDDAARARVVADFIAGMTDPFALAEYARLFDEHVQFR